MKKQQSFFYSDNSFRYNIIPPLFLFFFVNVVQFLAITGQGQEFSVFTASYNLLGNKFSWIFVTCLCVWGFVSLKVPAPVVLGPGTSFGWRPRYKDNGFVYYWMSLTAFLALQTIYPCYEKIYDNLPQIMAILNHYALILCTWLLIKGKTNKDHEGDVMEPKPILYEFYRGIELHPTLLGVDIKQWTNCRVGLIAWQLFITAFYLTNVDRNGFNMAALVNFALQTFYIAKFFWWEAGYFYTLDMMLDRAGWYLCWGCLVWVPCFYTYSSYYLVAHSPTMGASGALLWTAIGTATIVLNYMVDYEKQIFRQSNFKLYLWGDNATYVLARYKDHVGEEKETALLTSGFWGVARHLNYTFELICTLSWCMPGYGYGIWPFLYFYYLVILFVHRTIRDETKCKKKYGPFWDEYCNQVPYRIVPYVW